MNGNRLLVLFLLFAFAVTSAYADIVRYTDKDGKTHYVDNPNKVPEEYKSQLEDAKPLPSISKVEGGNDDYSPVAPVQPSKAQKSAQKNNSSLSKLSLKKDKKVEVFVTSWCGYCRKLEKFLNDNNIRYTRYDVEADMKGKKLYDSLGGTGYPLTRIGEKIIRGYSTEKVTEALRN